MNRYHLNPKTGEPSMCRAKQTCPFGDLKTEHFNSKDAARQAFESRQGSFGNNLYSLLSRRGETLIEQDPYGAIEQLSRERNELRMKLTNEQKNAIDNYALTSFEDVNEHLRNGQDEAEDYTKKIIQNLDEAFKHASATERRLYRVIALPSETAKSEFISNATEAKKISDQAYVSTTTSVDTALWLAARIRGKGKKPLLMEVASNKGIALQRDSEPNASRIQSLESEVLLPRDSKFEVVTVEKRKKLVFGQDRPELAEFEAHFAKFYSNFFTANTGLNLPTLKLVQQ